MILETVTLDGLHFRKPGKGGAYRASLPFTPEADAYDPQWDAETMTLTYLTPGEPDAEGVPGDPVRHLRTITQAEVDAAVEEITTPRPAPVPQKVTKAQLKLALLSSEIDLSALIAQLPAQEQPIAQILVDDATHFERGASFVGKLGQVAGMTSEEIDDLFRQAAQIDPAQI